MKSTGSARVSSAHERTLRRRARAGARRAWWRGRAQARQRCRRRRAQPMRVSLGVLRAGREHGQRARRGPREREDTANTVVLACVAAAGADAPQPASKDRSCRAAMRSGAGQHASRYPPIDAGGFLPTEKLWFLPPSYQEPTSFLLQKETVSSLFFHLLDCHVSILLT
jgi:hypothetical protein